MKHTFELDEITVIKNLPFKLDYNGGLWVDGGDSIEDLLLDTIELDEELDEFDVEITDDMLKKALEHSSLACSAMIDLSSDNQADPYRWMIEGIEDDTWNSSKVVEAQLDQIISRLVSDEWPYDTDDVIGYFRTLDEYSAAVAALEGYRNEWMLNQVMTVAEVAEEFGINEDGVRKAISRGRFNYRQSGTTYLLLRREVAQMWKARTS